MQVHPAIISAAITAILIGAIGSMAYSLGFVLQQAEAQTNYLTLSGRVTNSSGTGISGAKVYIDGFRTSGIPRSFWTVVTTDSSGNWSTSNVVLSGYTYTVEASKLGYERDRFPSQITTSQSGINITIDTQTAKTVDIYVVPDEEFRSQYPGNWQTTVWSKIASKGSVYRDNWNVNLNFKYLYQTWNSPNGTTNAATLMSNAATATGWSGGQYQGADVMAIVSRQSPLLCNGIQAAGCGQVPGSSGTHPQAIINEAATGIPSDIYNHELMHNYGFNHISTNYATMMQIGTGVLDYNTLSPPEDLTMAMNGSSSKRLWY